MIFLLWLAACGTPDTSTWEPYVRDASLDVDLMSEAGGTSHRAGEPCTQCHSANGDGPGRFQASGTVYDLDGAVVSAGSIALWAGGREAGTLLVELPIDASGNFYTTDDLGLPDVPVQPVVVAPDGTEVNQMPWPSESAACNQCHTPGLRVTMP
jgi:hypothetical protein